MTTVVHTKAFFVLDAGQCMSLSEDLPTDAVQSWPVMLAGPVENTTIVGLEELADPFLEAAQRLEDQIVVFEELVSADHGDASLVTRWKDVLGSLRELISDRGLGHVSSPSVGATGPGGGLGVGTPDPIEGEARKSRDEVSS